MEISKARGSLKHSLTSETAAAEFLKSCPFLKNILLEVMALYKKHSSAYSHMTMFLNLMERQIDKSIHISKTKRG